MADAGHRIDAQALAERVVAHMVDHDAFSRWLGIEVLEVRPGGATVRTTVREEMLNGFGVCHGGVTFSVADSAFAFASNTHGRVSLSIENSMTYPAAVRAGDVLVARAEEESGSARLGFFRVVVTNQREETVALFRGTVYKTSRDVLAAADSRDRD
jgi:acyl-CoA thioesterase